MPYVSPPFGPFGSGTQVDSSPVRRSISSEFEGDCMIQALLYDLSVAVLDIKACFKLCGDVMLATSKSVVAAEPLWKALCLVVAELPNI